MTLWTCYNHSKFKTKFHDVVPWHRERIAIDSISKEDAWA